MASSNGLFHTLVVIGASLTGVGAVFGCGQAAPNATPGPGEGNDADAVQGAEAAADAPTTCPSWTSGTAPNCYPTIMAAPQPSCAAQGGTCLTAADHCELFAPASDCALCCARVASSSMPDAASDARDATGADDAAAESAASCPNGGFPPNCYAMIMVFIPSCSQAGGTCVLGGCGGSSTQMYFPGCDAGGVCCMPGTFDASAGRSDADAPHDAAADARDARGQ